MSRANNDNVNVGFPKGNNNVNDNVGKHRLNPNRKADVERIARDLCKRLHNDGAYEWYMKLAWHLAPSVLYGNLEKAQKGRSPKALFTWLCKQSLQTSSL